MKIGETLNLGPYSIVYEQGSSENTAKNFIDKIEEYVIPHIENSGVYILRVSQALDVLESGDGEIIMTAYTVGNNTIHLSMLRAGYFGCSDDITTGRVGSLDIAKSYDNRQSTSSHIDFSMEVCYGDDESQLMNIRFLNNGTYITSGFENEGDTIEIIKLTRIA